MLTDDGFHAWCLQNRIPAQTKAYIERIRSTQPLQKPSIQLDWLKSLTNQSQLLYILVGNFSLYDFCHLNGQVARRVREEQFCRYHLDQQADAVEFTSALKVLVEQLPLQVNKPRHGWFTNPGSDDDQETQGITVEENRPLV